MSFPIPEGDAFVAAWNALERRDRRRVRRLIHLGRRLADGREAALGVAYARFRRGRLRWRLFWLWFIPGMLAALLAASRIHPVLVGVVLALGAQAAFARRSLSRVERINAAMLGDG